MRLPIKAQIRTQKNVKCVNIIKCTKVRTLFAKNKVRFAVRNNYAYVRTQSRMQMQCQSVAKKS